MAASAAGTTATTSARGGTTSTAAETTTANATAATAADARGIGVRCGATRIGVGTHILVRRRITIISGMIAHRTLTQVRGALGSQTTAGAATRTARIG